MSDFYTMLGVSRSATPDEIKRAYRKLAMKYHPDRSDEPDAEERFKEVTRAYEVLRDPDQRSVYDRYGEAGLRRGGAAGGGFGTFDFGDAFEVFMREFGGLGDLFGGARRGPEGRSRRGGDVKIRVKITLEEAATGAKRAVRVKLLDACEACGGNGAAAGSNVERCATCGGAGEVRQVQRSMLGQFVTVRPCPTCRGAGEIVTQPCEACEGDGRKRADRVIDLDIPAGVSSEDILKLSGRGHAGSAGGPRGDIVVLVEVEPDERFERRGDDLIHNLAVTMSQAALGAKIEVPTIIDGTAMLEVPAGIQAGQALRLRDRGMPRLRAGGRGDLIVRVLVWTPTNLSRDERKALEQLREVEQVPPPPDAAEPGFWQRVKRAFSA